jgi:hypothetical protein
MSAALTQLLTLLVEIVGGLTDATQIGSVIATLEQIITSGITEIEDIGPIIQNIISALQSNSSVTAAQLAQLQTQEAALDAAFEAAATAAGAPPAS